MILEWLILLFVKKHSPFPTWGKGRRLAICKGKKHMSIISNLRGNAEVMHRELEELKLKKRIMEHAAITMLSNADRKAQEAQKKQNVCLLASSNAKDWPQVGLVQDGSSTYTPTTCSR